MWIEEPKGRMLMFEILHAHSGRFFCFFGVKFDS